MAAWYDCFELPFNVLYKSWKHLWAKQTVQIQIESLKAGKDREPKNSSNRNNLLSLSQICFEASGISVAKF